MNPKDIVARLRAERVPGETITGDVQLYLDAADEIERLREEIDKAETETAYSVCKTLTANR